MLLFCTRPSERHRNVISIGVGPIADCSSQTHQVHSNLDISSTAGLSNIDTYKLSRNRPRLVARKLGFRLSAVFRAADLLVDKARLLSRPSPKKTPNEQDGYETTRIRFLCAVFRGNISSGFHGNACRILRNGPLAGRSQNVHRKLKVAVMTILSSPMSSKVVLMTTPCATNDGRQSWHHDNSRFSMLKI